MDIGFEIQNTGRRDHARDEKCERTIDRTVATATVDNKQCEFAAGTTLGRQHRAQQSGSFGVRNIAKSCEVAKGENVERVIAEAGISLMNPKKTLRLKQVPPQGLEPWTR